MRRSWRPLVLAVACLVGFGSGIASAQTVIVTNLKPGASVDVTMAGKSLGSGTADAEGDARMAADFLDGTTGRDAEVVLDVHLDACGDSWSVVANVHGLQPPPPTVACVRKNLAGPFVVRHVTTLVIDSTDPPVLKIRQGPAPAEWLRHGPAAIPLPVVARHGLSLFAGGGLNEFADILRTFCGDASGCQGTAARPTLSVGGVYWLTSFLGAEVGYYRGREVPESGGDSTFSFKSTLKSNFLTIAANGGIRMRRVRVYGQIGGDYHQATSSTTEVINSQTITLADGTTETLPGATQTTSFRTRGWGLFYGAGGEVWASRSTAIYVQGAFAKIKGKDRDGGEGSLDDRTGVLMFGVRIHLFGGADKAPAAAAAPAK